MIYGGKSPKSPKSPRCSKGGEETTEKFIGDCRVITKHIEDKLKGHDFVNMLRDLCMESQLRAMKGSGITFIYPPPSVVKSMLNDAYDRSKRISVINALKMYIIFAIPEGDTMVFSGSEYPDGVPSATGSFIKITGKLTKSYADAARKIYVVTCSEATKLENTEKSCKVSKNPRPKTSGGTSADSFIVQRYRYRNRLLLCNSYLNDMYENMRVSHEHKKSSIFLLMGCSLANWLEQYYPDHYKAIIHVIYPNPTMFLLTMILDDKLLPDYMLVGTRSESELKPYQKYGWANTLMIDDDLDSNWIRHLHNGINGIKVSVDRSKLPKECSDLEGCDNVLKLYDEFVKDSSINGNKIAMYPKSREIYDNPNLNMKLKYDTFGYICEHAMREIWSKRMISIENIRDFSHFLHEYSSIVSNKDIPMFGHELDNQLGQSHAIENIDNFVKSNHFMYIPTVESCLNVWDSIKKLYISAAEHVPLIVLYNQDRSKKLIQGGDKPIEVVNTDKDAHEKKESKAPGNANKGIANADKHIDASTPTDDLDNIEFLVGQDQDLCLEGEHSEHNKLHRSH